MHKRQPENFAGQKRAKTAKRTRNRPKRAKPGAFWVLEGMRTVKGRCKRMGKTGKLGGNRGTDLSRLPARSARGRAPLALARPTTRTARGAAAPCCQDIPHANEKNQVPQLRYLIFLAGAEGLEPSARGFGVDVEERKRERGRGGVARFLLQDENVRCWFGAFRFSRSKTRIESPLEISLRMSSLKSYICMYTEE